MATDLEVGDVIAIRAWCTSQEQASVNTYFYSVDAVPFVPVQDQDCAQEFSTIYEASMKALLATTSTFNGIQCQIIDRGFPTQLFVAASDTSDAGPGIVAGTELPRQTCGLISWQTPLAGRKFRGRTYIPFPPTSFDSGTGIPSVGYVGGLVTLAGIIRSFNGSFRPGLSLTQLVWHRNFPRAVPPIPPDGTPIVNFSAASRWATQRRRGSFGRANVSPI